MYDITAPGHLQIADATCSAADLGQHFYAGPSPSGGIRGLTTTNSHWILPNSRSYAFSILLSYFHYSLSFQCFHQTIKKYNCNKNKLVLQRGAFVSKGRHWTGCHWRLGGAVGAASPPGSATSRWRWCAGPAVASPHLSRLRNIGQKLVNSDKIFKSFTNSLVNLTD